MKYHCNICGCEGKEFLPMGKRPFARCPVCHSLERHRAFVAYLKQKDFLVKPGGKCLEAAPLNKYYIKLMSDIFNYVTVDLDSPLAMHHMDLTDLKFPDEEFDFIICFHVLEHIKDDHKAMRELHRCLKKDGLAIIAVPFRTDITKTVEFAAPDPLQSLHVREYGVDVVWRLVKAGFDVEVLEALKYVPAAEDARCNMAGSLPLFLARK